MVNQQNLSGAGVVIRLDIDAVLHQEGALWNSRRGVHMCPKQAPRLSLFEWLLILDAAVAPCPQIKLVLSSTWCIWPGFGKTVKRFPLVRCRRFGEGTFHNRVHGTDPCVGANFQEILRGQRVWQDVQRRKPAQWVTSAGGQVWQRWLAINKVGHAVDVTNEVLTMGVSS